MPGLTVELHNSNGELVEGTSYPQQFLERDHREGKCDAWCSYCYEEACQLLVAPQSTKCVGTPESLNQKGG